MKFRAFTFLVLWAAVLLMLVPHGLTVADHPAQGAIKSQPVQTFARTAFEQSVRTLRTYHVEAVGPGIYRYGIPRPDYAVWLANYRYDNRVVVKRERGRLNRLRMMR